MVASEPERKPAVLQPTLEPVHVLPRPTPKPAPAPPKPEPASPSVSAHLDLSDKGL